jgi:hypothetical protein
MVRAASEWVPGRVMASRPVRKNELTIDAPLQYGHRRILVDVQTEKLETILEKRGSAVRSMSPSSL